MIFRASGKEIVMVKALEKLALAALGGLLVVAGTPLGSYAQEFYQNKTVRFVVGFSPGGGFDTYTRAIARHIGKHIPGSPTIIVENMTGAGSLIAANYTYRGAKADGLTVGIWNGAYVLRQALGDKAVRLDGRKLGWESSSTRASSSGSALPRGWRQSARSPGKAASRASMDGSPPRRP
jgi:tripartite-type tricarboxylate transporter receptor subunit TctC